MHKIIKNKPFATLTLLLFVALVLTAAYYVQGPLLPIRKSVFIKFSSSQFKQEEMLKNSKAVVDISYPQIESGLNYNSIKSFNEFLRKFTADIFEEYRSWFNDLDVVLPLKESTTLAESSVTGGYEIIKADERIISIRFKLDRSWGSMAHPYDFTKVVNYSVKDNRNMSLSDLFINDSNYLVILSNITKQKIIEGYKADKAWDEGLMSFVDNGTKPQISSFMNFVIGGDYLLFIFDPYEVGPYAVGKREAKIMFRELEGYLNRKYVQTLAIRF